MALPSAGPTDCSSGLAARIFNNMRYDNPWQSGATVVVGALACPTTPNGFGYKCTAITTGVTSGAEPTWPIILTNSVVDGGVTWTAQDIANPSGKNHAPLVQFGYSMSTTEQDAYRLLAYDTARGIADEIGGGSDHCTFSADTAAGQSIANATVTIVVFGTANWDSDTAFNTGTGRFTVPPGKGGDYHVDACCTWLLDTKTDICTMQVFVNGTVVRNLRYHNAGGCPPMMIATTLRLAAGDVVDIRVSQTAGINAQLDTTRVDNYFQMSHILGS